MLVYSMALKSTQDGKTCTRVVEYIPQIQVEGSGKFGKRFGL